MNKTRADTKRGNMVREERKQKKSAENKKSNNKERKHKIKRIKFFFGEVFFLNRNRRNKIFFKDIEKRIMANCF